MQVRIIEPIGFCNGVRKTIDLIYRQEKDSSLLLGAPIHNEEFLKTLEQDGYQVIKENEIPLYQNKTIITSAHGATLDTISLIKEKNKHCDTTCEVIKNIYKIIEKNKKKKILLLGDKNHQEVKGILSRYPNVIAIGPYEKKPDFKNPDDYLLIAQSTANQNFFDEMSLELKQNYHIKSIDTICPFVKKRFANAMSLDANLIIVVGDKSSSNSNQLFDLIKNCYSDKNVIFVSNLEELKTYDLSKYDYANILSGTSTPLFVINEICEYLRYV